MAYHTRIIQLNYDDKKPQTFTNDEEAQAYYAAIGRLVTYNLAREGENSIDMVNISSVDQKECLAVYSARLPERRTDEQGETWHFGSNGVLVDAFVLDFRTRASVKHRPFVVGAVNSGGKWGFHS